ncbi:Fe-S cluster assembly protein hesB [Tupanvirus soda lake]|uniref:Fe-S cluster assembly protein hesB n=1 Tax=Tupanvirus deep ocean TaxID=2126984 RepID=A0A2K9L455_9VIRU|nr:Fe-S cluster assembly protein hesB [Tupanvirus soda lake]AUL77942.2 Fe-S cluster assembly protein hesB [Tupanvirus soda lake]
MKIYTIGHSNRPLNVFIKILIQNRVRCLVDVRSYPGSRAVPQFNKENLGKALAKYKIKYIHVPELGGRRKIKTNIHNSIEAPGFAGYADYMASDSFKNGISILKKIARQCKTAYMCAEGPWWKCHRRMVSDRLEFDNWDVFHLGIKKDPVPHVIWNIARLDESNNIVYDQ